MVNVALHQIVCMISLLVLYVMLPLLLAIEVTLLTPPVSGILLLHNEISLQRLTLTLIGLQLSAVSMQGRGGEIWIVELLIPCIPIEII